MLWCCFDSALYHDLHGSIAIAIDVWQRLGVLTNEERDNIRGLKGEKQTSKPGRFQWSVSLEDVAHDIERVLTIGRRYGKKSYTPAAAVTTRATDIGFICVTRLT